MLAALRARSRTRRASRPFGLDIGSTAVKLVELRGAGPSLAVARCASIPIAAGIVAEGGIRDAEAAGAAIRQAAAAAGVTGSEAVIGICGRELIIKKLQIPEIPAKALPDAVRIEAEREIPFAIDEVFLDYHITGQQNRVIDLTLVAAKKTKVLEYHAVVSAAGFTPAVIDVDGFALGNQHELVAGASAERVAVADVGATMTKIAVVGGGLTHLVRDVPLGGCRYTQAIAARLGISFERAEAIKTGAASSPDPRAVTDACAGITRDLGREIQRALDYHAESDVAAPPVTGVSLVGGASAFAGLAESLASLLGLPVAVDARPFAGLTVDPACAATVASAGTSLALALGLGLRRREPASS
jgi:type IV pilus assembly protein PilM